MSDLSHTPNNRLVIRKAERRKSKLRLALCGPSGAGKTMSALLLAFGIGGKVGLIDTEHGSGDLYADLGDYDVISLEPPYTVAKYREAIRAFEDAGYSTIIVDSLSHAWAGEGGLLDKQGQLEASGRYRNSFATWREITPEQNKLVEEMLASPAHIIATMRSKMEWIVEKDDRGRATVRKVGLAPVQRDGITFEFTIVMDLSESHTATATKDRTSLLDGWCDRISRDTGKMLRDWLDSGAEPAPRSVGAAAATVVQGPRKVAAVEYQDGGIPSLDDELSAESKRRQPKRTVAEWLQDLETRLMHAASREETEAVLMSNDVCRAARSLTGTGRDRLRSLMDTALARHTSAEAAP
jgi:hypothetical protein